MRIQRLTKETMQNLLKELLKRSPDSYGEYEDRVAAILKNVKENGDEALFSYTSRFDHADLTKNTIRVTNQEIEDAYRQTEASLIQVIRKALENIRSYHEKQKQYSWFDSKPDGTMLGQKVTPIHRVGVYVPGGKAVYPSSVLMNVIPARIAGVDEIIMVTPPRPDGTVSPHTPLLRQKKLEWTPYTRWAAPKPLRHSPMERKVSKKPIRS